MMIFTLKSSDFIQNGIIPKRFSCDGEDLSPHLEWTGIPQNTVAFVLIMDDPDALMGTWDHWLLFNIPSTITKLEAGIKQLPEGTKVGRNSWQRNDYGGPCPPDREHRYFFKLYALDTLLELPYGATKKEIEAAMQSHIIFQATLIGRYNRPQNRKA
ncbi:MAG: YbhB/YbcL family Raf kinase inhibitor-like protein [Alphaproteobacteria bacterium]|nr:YbhB/YbcL family Raf kinase inhibitor-like protein [Alphaproteobacteria bacterium]